MKPSNFCGKSLVSNLPLLSIENRSHVRSRITRELPWNLDYRFSVEPGYSIFIHRSLENNGFWDQLSTRLLATLIITGTSDRSGVTDRSYRGIDDSFMVQRMPVFLIFSFFFFVEEGFLTRREDQNFFLFLILSTSEMYWMVASFIMNYDKKGFKKGSTFLL